MRPKINNDYYNTLGTRWYDASDDPIAVLRAEQKLKNPWVLKAIEKHFSPSNVSLCDIGCGGGFLTNFLSDHLESVVGIDQSDSSLKIAKENSRSANVEYIKADAYKLPFADESFDVVCAMDFLEHVEDPQKVIQEASRILRPGGLFFYHTFNRTPLAYLIVIKFMEWFVPNTPKNLHVYHLFIKPSELFAFLRSNKLVNLALTGLRPKFDRAFFKSLMRRKVHPDFNFGLTRDKTLGYMGYAQKKKD